MASIRSWASDPRPYRVLAVLWMGLICCLSSSSHIPAPSMFPGQDKLAHAAVFGILGVLFIQGLGPRDSTFSVWKVLLITAMVAAFGALDEIHQSFVPGRDASLGDLAADAAGGFAAAVVFRIRSSFTRARPRTDGKLKDKPRNMAGGHKHPIVCP